MTNPYHIKIAPSVCRQIQVFPPKQQKIIIKLIEALSVNPRPPGAVKIDGLTGLYREDLDFFHLVYKVEEQEVLVLLIK